MGGGSHPGRLSDQQLLQTLISFYRRETVGTVALHSLRSLRLKILPSLGTRRYVTSQTRVCVFPRVSAAAKSSVLAFASYRDLRGLPVPWLLDHDPESQEVRKPATVQRGYRRVAKEMQR